MICDSLPLRLDQPIPKAIPDQLCLRVEVKLVHHVRAVCLGCAAADEERAGNLLAGLPLNRKVEHEAFSLREADLGCTVGQTRQVRCREQAYYVRAKILAAAGSAARQSRQSPLAYICLANELQPDAF